MITYQCEKCGKSYGTVYVTPTTQVWTCVPCLEEAGFSYAEVRNWTSAQDWRDPVEGGCLCDMGETCSFHAKQPKCDINR